MRTCSSGTATTTKSSRRFVQKLSVIYVNLGDYAKGEAELELLLQRNPDEAGANNDLGYLYAEQGKNLEKAEAMIRKALQEDAENKPISTAWAGSCSSAGKVKEALEPLKKAAEQMKEEVDRRGTSPDATILEHLGDVYFQLQDLDKAGDAWREAAKGAEQAVPPDKRVPEIRKKLESLEKLGPIPKSTATTSEHPERTEMAGHSHSANIAHRKGWSTPSAGSSSPSSAGRSTWPRGPAAAIRPRTCGCATRSTRRARSASPRTTSSARSRRRPASSAPRTSRKSSTRATAPAAWPCSARP